MQNFRTFETECELLARKIVGSTSKIYVYLNVQRGSVEKSDLCSL